MKMAVIGTGYWGKNHVRVLNELLEEKKIDELFVCDVDENKIKEIADAFEIPHYTNYKELITSDVDGVVIATPSETHYEIAKEFLEAGKNVLVEKPMTLDSKEADELIKIAEDNERILMVGHIFRYHPAVIELRNKIKRGDFGDVYYMISNRFSLRYPRKDMGVLFALGIHEVDIFCYLLNKKYPREIMAVTSNYTGKMEETAEIITFFEDDIKGYAFESWITPVYGKKRELIVVGSKMSAFVNYLKPNEIHIFDATISPRVVATEGSYTIPIEYKEPLKEELKDFLNCIKTGKTPIANMHVGKRAVEIIERAIFSSKEKKAVKI